MSGAIAAIAAVASALDTQTVTSALTGTTGFRVKGYKSTATSQGSISPGTSAIYGGAAITEMYFYENTGNFTLTITGATNSGWTTMTNVTDGNSLSRAAASFSGGTWTWAGQTISQFFGLAGAKIVTFT